VIDDPIAQCVCHLCPEELAVWIKVLFGMYTLGGPRNIALDGGHDSPTDSSKGSGRNFTNCMSVPTRSLDGATFNAALLDYFSRLLIFYEFWSMLFLAF